MAETVRTFIAIELSPEARRFVGECQDRLRRAGGDVRWVRPDRIHLTRVVLGGVPAEALADLEAAVREAAGKSAPFTVRMAGAGQFPPRGAPRVVWVGVSEPTGALGRLQASIAEATAAFAEKVEDRAYAPHLTVGRVKGGRDLGRLSEAIAAMAAEEGPTIEACEVVVFRSDLAPEGPTYTPVARVALGEAR